MRMCAFRFAALAASLIALSGCSVGGFTYTTDRYGLTSATNVTLRCRDTYEVYDRPDLSTVLVVSNPLNEALNCLEGGQPPLVARQREAARIFLEEKTNRPQCRVGSDMQLSIYHREFTYACGALPPNQRQS